MATPLTNQTVNTAFYQPIQGLADQSQHARACPEVTDADYLHQGVQRVLEASKSGRAFLQEHGARFENPPQVGNYFAALHSERRRAVLREVNHAVLATAQAVLADRLKEIPELSRYEIFATDGHWHQGATHDPRHKEMKMAVGHFYSLNLRTHTLSHLATGVGLHEHDTTALKRIKPTGLRQGVPKGRRVLNIHDKACIDFDYWDRCRRESAVYFLSRPKSNQVLTNGAERTWNRKDSRNDGVETDVLVNTSEGHQLRLITYRDGQTGTRYEFLTNEMDLPPGVLAELYRRRWDLEKVFDDLKNKLGQKKAWGSSLVAKETQAQFLVLTHNLLLRYEQRLERQQGVKNEAEDQRREKRAALAIVTAASKGLALSSLAVQARRTTQRSVKFIRWLRRSLRDQLAEATAVFQLKLSYAKP